MSYRERPAPPELVPWVQCLWESTSVGLPKRVLPDGCIDIVHSAAIGTRLVGPNTVAFVSEVPRGLTTVGVRMRPGGAPALLGVNPVTLRDGQPPLSEILGDPGARLGAALESSADPAATLAAWLARRVARATRPDPLVAAVAASHDRPPPAAAIARALGVSERTLRRRVTDAVGYGPKRLQRVLRLHRALAFAADPVCGGDLARVAYEAGYADQAHLGHDCRALAGVAPTALLR